MPARLHSVGGLRPGLEPDPDDDDDEAKKKAAAAAAALKADPDDRRRQGSRQVHQDARADHDQG